jgi:hypothetical protein
MSIQTLLQKHGILGLAEQITVRAGATCTRKDIDYMRLTGTVPSHWLAPVVELLREEGLDPSADDILTMVRRTRRGKHPTKPTPRLGANTDNFGERASTPQVGDAA